MQQISHSVVIARRGDGDTHADSGIGRPECSGDRALGNQSTNLICPTDSNPQIASRKDDQEFLATIAANQIVRPQIHLQSPRDFLENDVASMVPPGIITLFTVI